MSIKRLLFRFLLRGMEKCFLLHGLSSLYHSGISTDSVDNNSSVVVITIAFNNSKVIALHNGYVLKNLAGNVTHIVVDNSTNMEESMRIREICENSHVGYIRLHKNRLGAFSGSYSHAAAVNWTYKHLICPMKPYAFGFIDHDIFPAKPVDIQSVICKQPVWGAQRQRGAYWYLSAIISFFRLDFVKENGFDFMPVTYHGVYLDSGGGNWPYLYSKMNVDELSFMSVRMENFREGDNRHQDQIELFDDDRWVHTINGSYWKKIDVVKEDILSDLIRQYE